MITPERLHYLLIRHIIEHGYAPSNAAELLDLGATTADPALTETNYSESLAQLAGMHGVILEPGSQRIWSLHPFSTMPTAFWVSAGDRGWWANCAWCSLGIGAAINEDTEIATRDGAEDEPLKFSVRNGESSRSDLLMHFPYPPAQWWDNPYCPCGNILFFSSDARVNDWSRRHGRPRGELLQMPDALRLAQRWFGDYATPGWRRKTPLEAQAIFEELGLEPRFWNIGGSFR